ncbi:uncharacterized protein GGS22DRAFT_71636 [Annulohypoxylon maeteangense]|uniref:uncharacterized protein n=1 Tax=Annulohypoxylon maeteangense TaxID=1927788 RepID=UPI0020076A7F|nr:uncharacterized protein GGS22DRAFT_71636 [Annulohypoxylon maeteangense]KAI0889479.1 hypothetical protein GGS22DRAFT_71636 [Annulohypoxylon maeteangense]
MATTSGQQSANLANNTSSIARNSNTSGHQLSESPTPGLTAPSPTLAGPTANGNANGLLPSTLPHDASMHHDLRLYPRDGRVRNPVPSKLKDVTEQMKGNFSVMHMDVASHRASEGRDAAAKRTSESTALQAKLAQTDTYVSHQRRANYPRPPGLKQFTSPRKSTEPPASAAPAASPAPVSVPAPTPTPVPVPAPAAAPAVPAAAGPTLTQPLTVAETKAEQARLLTLLRTLAPALVVDQLCKALAFFGGIPDAPPPTDGKFPESAEANGPGSLFVGWIAEIFPNLDEPRRRAPIPSSQYMNQRRPRGRPKGSKATKSRSDKGIKKINKGTSNRAQEPQDDSWVDVDESVMGLNGDDDLVEIERALANAPSTPPRVPDAAQFGNTPATGGSTGGFKSINDSNTIAPNSSTKRRGRPKGSKNRPKEMTGSQPGGQSAESALSNLSVSHQADHVSAIPIPPKVTPVPVPIPMLGEQLNKKKANSGRPKGSKNRPKAPNEPTAQDSTTSQQQTPDLLNHQNSQRPSYTAGISHSFASSSTAPAITNASASQKDKQTQGPISSGVSSTQVPMPTPQVKESTISGKKRKRQPAPASVTNPPTQTDGVSNSVGGSHPISQQGSSTISQATPTSVSQVQSSAGQPIQPPVSSAAAPSAKRSRKSQEAGSLHTSKRSTPNSMGTKNSANSATATLDPAHQTSQVATSSQGHIQADGLEAHYERIAALNQNLGDQVQGNANRSQKQQQHHQATAPIGHTASPVPAEGLEAHYERFTALQNRQENPRQPTASRQQMQQQTAQTASPIPSQTSKGPQMPSTLTSHQQTRTSQSYYPQAQTLSSSYNAQTPTYSTNQRQPQHMATGSPGTSLVQHITNSPQFGAQSNSPLMQGDTNYRGSPSLVHNNPGYPPRRTPSASPLDNNYRTSSSTGHGVSNHSPHFGARQTPTTTHSTSHPTMSSAFTPFTESGLFDMQGLDSSSNHGGLGLGTGSYGLGSGGGGGVPPQQRTTASSAASLYSSTTGMSNSYLSSNVGRTTQNRWPS